jgi:hypothetical protein
MSRQWLVRKLWPISVRLNRALFSCSPHYRPGQTVSEHAAIGQGLAYRPACWLCRLLNVLERDHCGKSAPPTPANVLKNFNRPARNNTARRELERHDG